MAKLDITEIIAQLQNMDWEQSFEKLSSYTKAELIEIANVAGISVSKTGKKDTIIGQISNHYGFRRLNKDMAARPPMQR